MRAWRTLVRVVFVEGDVATVVLPAWRHEERVQVKLGELPQDVRGWFWPDVRLHARVNIGAASADELCFSEWEPR